MSRLRKFRALTSAERHLLLQAMALLLVVSFALRTLPFRWADQLRGWFVDRRLGRGARVSPAPQRVTWAVAAAGRVLPRARTCLTQAIAAQILLARYGLSTQLCFGVVLREPANLLAHAWLEHEGRILIGGEGSEGYVRLHAGRSRAL